jgi:hypothetical protein
MDQGQRYYKASHVTRASKPQPRMSLMKSSSPQEQLLMSFALLKLHQV